MAKKTTDITYNMDLTLTAEQAQAVKEMADNPNLTDVQKIGGGALNCLQNLVAGAILLEPDEVARIKEATGAEFSCGEDLIPYLSEATGVEEGYYTFKVKIDPAYHEAVKEIADIRGWEVNQLIQEAIDNAFVNGWFESIPDNRIAMVNMSASEKAGLEDLLGGKFSNGTELAAMIRKLTGEDTGIFSDLVSSNVGQEG